MNSILDSVSHRPYPIPSPNWIMKQDWNELLFAHWPVKVEEIRDSIPAELEIDTYDGWAWIGLVPFRMDNVEFRYIPYKVDFLELNVRTYVKFKDYLAVYFFSLDATHRLAVETARLWFGLPYLNAQMKIAKAGDSISYKSTRKDNRSEQANLDVTYRPIGDKFESNPGSIEHFLTERYCLFSKRKNSLIRGDIHHQKWQLFKAEAEFANNSMFFNMQNQSNDFPLLNYSKTITTVEWAPQVVPIS